MNNQRNILILIPSLFLTCCAISMPKDFLKLSNDSTFVVVEYNNHFHNDERSLLVSVNRGKDDDQVFYGTIPNRLNARFFVFPKSIYYLENQSWYDRLANLYICDGVTGSFYSVARVSKDYYVTKDGGYYIYKQEKKNKPADIIIKSRNNKTIKKISGSDFLNKSKVGLRKESYQLYLKYDQDRNIAFFSYGMISGGYIEFPSLKIILVNGDEYNTMMDTYFPNAGM